MRIARLRIKGASSLQTASVRIKAAFAFGLFAFVMLLTLNQTSTLPPSETASPILGIGKPERALSFSNQTSLRQLESFLLDNPDTPAAHLVKLLRQHLHTPATAEAERLGGCWRNSNVNLCLAGHAEYHRSSDPQDERRLSVPLWENDPNQTVYDLTHYANGRKIGNLGTNMACIPLLLAGYAATLDRENVVVELGPFLGFSSKCIATGMRKNGVRDDTFFVYDTFSGSRNFKAIKRMNPWLAKEHPEYTSKNDNYLFLWEYGVKPAYPSVVTRQGFVGKDTLNPQALGNRPVGLISIDSAKSNKDLKDQLAGLGPLRKGALLMMMDFEFVREHIRLFFACLREHYFMPVYLSWSLEHWMWIVTNDVDLADDSHYQCYSDYTTKASKARQDEVVALAESDLIMLSGLSNNVTVTDTFTQARARIFNTLEHILKME